MIYEFFIEDGKIIQKKHDIKNCTTNRNGDATYMFVGGKNNSGFKIIRSKELDTPKYNRLYTFDDDFEKSRRKLIEYYEKGTLEMECQLNKRKATLLKIKLMEGCDE